MKILATAPFLPWPPIDGGRIVAYHHVRGLAGRGLDVTMIYAARRAEDTGNAAHLEPFGTVRVVPARARSAVGAAAAALARGGSLRVERHRVPGLQEAVVATLEEESGAPFDVVLLDSMFTAYLVPAVRAAAPRARIVLFEHNVESQVFRRLVTTTRSPGWRLLSAWETPRVEAAERRAAEAVDRVLTLSREDADTLRALAPAANVSVLGPGVATSAGEAIAPPPEPRRALFLGSYHWPPNRDAVRWLLREIWPRVRRRLPDARLVLAGNDPSGEMRALADPAAGVEARGFVEDVAATTREAAVCLAPLRFGGGIRLKVLEALANERPVVGTTPGLEGLELTPGEHVTLADDAEGLAGAMAELLQDPERAARQARAGRAHVEETCSWDAVARRMEATFLELIEERRPDER
ncbi:MAG TPA: glycosyltransferase family 4 protein [bacterium]|nr:glycosyltransferase family 4 protein [bacterium]